MAFDSAAFKRKLEQQLRRAINRTTMQDVGDFAVELVQKRTRLGYGVPDAEAPREKLKELKQSYVSQRQKDRANGKLSSRTTPKKSNLTRTDQMISSIAVTKAIEGSVSYGPTGSRTDSKLSNKEVAEHVSKVRPFLSLSDREVKQVTDYLRKILDKFLKDI